VSEHELYVIARQLRYELTACQAKVTELLDALGRANLPAATESTCPICGVTCRGSLSLAEHVYHSHDGPEPEHWVEAEAKASIGGTA
jgi:hypothetical protein